MPVTEDQVKSLMLHLENPTSPDDLSLHLQAAELLVTEDLAGSGLSESRLDQITLFLAAHFATLAVEKGGLTRQEIGESSESYRSGSESDRGFYLTRYGSQAVAFDSTGTLASIADGAQKAEFRVV